MDYFSLAGIAVGLAMDALAVSISNGAVTKRVTPWFALKLALCFGLFQAFMPMLGWLVGKAGESVISSVDHWIALVLLCYIGIDTIIKAHRKKKCGETETVREDIPLKTLMMLAVATSIDALATGIILPSAVGASTVSLMLFSVAAIGIVTAFLCFFGVYIGKKFGCICSDRAETAGGIVLVAIGVKIFMDHMFFS